MLLYHLGAIGKILLGSIILLTLYFTINIYEDPAIGLSFGFIGIFIITRWVSFYLFWGMRKLFSHESAIILASESYKISLLFGMYVLSNCALIVSEQWTKLFGLLLAAGFILLHILLSQDFFTPRHD